VQGLSLILVVEDDQLIQNLVQEALTDAGFEPALVISAEEAIALLETKQNAYRALVTDINLPGKLSGWDVARAAREIDPTFPSSI
jgi:DNA-binding response OmpR family regulator